MALKADRRLGGGRRVDGERTVGILDVRAPRPVTALAVPGLGRRTGLERPGMDGALVFVDGLLVAGQADLVFFDERSPLETLVQLRPIQGLFRRRAEKARTTRQDEPQDEAAQTDTTFAGHTFSP